MPRTVARRTILALGAVFVGSLFMPWMCYPLYGKVECFSGFLSLIGIQPWMIKSVLEEGDFRYLPTVLAAVWPVLFWVWCVPIVFLARSRWRTRVFWALIAVVMVVALAPVIVNTRMGINTDFQLGYFVGQAVTLLGLMLVPWAVERHSARNSGHQPSQC